MTYSYRVSTNALKRIMAIVAKIEQQEPGLSITFNAQLQQCFDDICNDPGSGKNLFEQKHGFLMPSFNYLIIYTIHSDRSEVVIHTVVNPDKSTNHWLED